ncbi:MAG TPA: bifunctional 4-hydroxy-3-methylbut-2-enyl diphosphate reductase/30S ribosomal protein S1, partial [Firmicutes bacterium]|nr:bifunctional 4-hydroxy-3-methylbut-2-enyl diphosphate reductase/30S ribosomal protein S1 [Bacillota bacterium]
MHNHTIILAKSAGFCFGVRRAVDLVYALAKEGRKACTLGPIIHNQQVVNDLCSKGVRVIAKPSEAAPDETVVIRSHGVGRDIYEQLQAY